MEDLINELGNLGLNPIIIDEYTDFSKLPPLIPNEEKKQPKTNGKRNKAVGGNWERKIVLALKGIGYPFAATSRYVSKSRDDAKVDICNMDERKNGFLPFNVQAKSTTRIPKFNAILAEMPQEENTVNVVAFQQTEKQTSGMYKGKFLNTGEYAVMKFSDWLYYAELERKYKELLDENRRLRPE